MRDRTLPERRREGGDPVGTGRAQIRDHAGLSSGDVALLAGIGGQMPDYQAQIPVEDRWAIVAYLKALQLSMYAPLDAVPAADRGKLDENLPDAPWDLVSGPGAGVTTSS